MLSFFSQMGPTPTRSFYAFLERIALRCGSDGLSKTLYEMLFKLLVSLCSERFATAPKTTDAS